RFQDLLTGNGHSVRSPPGGPIRAIRQLAVYSIPGFRHARRDASHTSPQPLDVARPRANTGAGAVVHHPEHRARTARNTGAGVTRNMGLTPPGTREPALPEARGRTARKTGHVPLISLLPAAGRETAATDPAPAWAGRRVGRRGPGSRGWWCPRSRVCR